jgi:hypothetical protein
MSVDNFAYVHLAFATAGFRRRDQRLDMLPLNRWGTSDGCARSVCGSRPFTFGGPLLRVRPHPFHGDFDVKNKMCNRHLFLSGALSSVMRQQAIHPGKPTKA